MKRLHNTGFYFAVLLVLCVGISAAYTKPVPQEEPPRKKYIKFSHQFHIEGIGADCVLCHTQTPESTSASDNILPNKEDCFICHDDVTAPQEDCTLCHYDVDEAVNFPNPEREVLFNHQAHLERVEQSGDEACAYCHPGLETVAYATAESMPGMPTCTECHDNRAAAQYCESCHTALPTLRPESHQSTWMYRHDDAVRATNEDCAMCHTFNYCQECHDGAALSEISGAVPDNYASYAVQNWGVENLVLTRNHDLNYRYTHGIEAKSKQEKCQLCHDNETFCVTCHDNVLGGGTGKPEWHSGPDWGAIAFGRGSGGGRHAMMAKRDIANCASCHDANGEDPVCLMCHMDTTPGRNNDLRTHTQNLYKNVQGPWHSDNAYTCFTCHVNANRNDPAGFCGYCHGIR